VVSKARRQEYLQPQIPVDLYPNLTEIMGSIAASKGSRSRPRGRAVSSYSSEFEFGLDLILDGLQRVLKSR
jgi:hypothetical protein